MIGKQTATDIALAYREIETAEKLLADVGNEYKVGVAPDIRDAFGRQRTGLELGVPSGNGHRLFNVPWLLAKPIIDAHVAQQRSIIAALTEKARIEIGVAD